MNKDLKILLNKIDELSKKFEEDKKLTKETFESIKIRLGQLDKLNERLKFFEWITT